MLITIGMKVLDVRKLIRLIATLYKDTKYMYEQRYKIFYWCNKFYIILQTYASITWSIALQIDVFSLQYSMEKDIPHAILTGFSTFIYHQV